MPGTIITPGSDLVVPDPEKQGVIQGVMSEMNAKNMRIGGRSGARGGGKAMVDMTYAKDLASRRCGPAAEAAIGKALLKLAAEGADITGTAKAMGEILALAEGVVSGQPNAVAVMAANRTISPEVVLASQHEEGFMDLIVMSYAVLHLDEYRVLDGGVR